MANKKALAQLLKPATPTGSNTGSIRSFMNIYLVYFNPKSYFMVSRESCQIEVWPNCDLLWINFFCDKITICRNHIFSPNSFCVNIEFSLCYFRVTADFLCRIINLTWGCGHMCVFAGHCKIPPVAFDIWAACGWLFWIPNSKPNYAI